MNNYSDISNFIFESHFPFWLEIVKIVFISIIFLLFAVIVILFFKASWLESRWLKDAEEFFRFRPYGIGPIVKGWNKIKKRLELGTESEFKLAVIEADSLLQEVLEKMGFKGEGLEDRLQQLIPVVLSDIEPILEVHKIRNNILHEPDYKLSLEQAQKVIAVYEKTFGDLGVF